MKDKGRENLIPGLLLPWGLRRVLTRDTHRLAGIKPQVKTLYSLYIVSYEKGKYFSSSLGL